MERMTNREDKRNLTYSRKEMPVLLRLPGRLPAGLTLYSRSRGDGLEGCLLAGLRESRIRRMELVIAYEISATAWRRKGGHGTRNNGRSSSKGRPYDHWSAFFSRGGEF